MCGILGFIGNKILPDEKQFKLALEMLKSRGPDNLGLYAKEKVILGHSRLSIIDTSSIANQPFIYKDYVLVFNGEIYNFQELRKTLEEKKYVFKTNSDTEVLLYSYIEWGEKCVDYFDGMWAFCIYDIKKKKLFLSRDRIGEKPLVYFHSKNKFAFSSEIPSLLEILEENEKKISYQNISNFSLYNFKHIPSPYTPFENIFKLEPGKNLILNLKDFSIVKKKYTICNSIKISKNRIEQFSQLFETCVKQTCYADVKVAILLSGGVDSSLIAATLKNREIMTYTLGYDKNDPEIIRAKKIANHLNLKNKTIYYKDYLKKVNLIKVIKSNIKNYGEPINLFQIIYSDILLKEMKQDKIKVVIGGNGADELFNGYTGNNSLKILSDAKRVLDFSKLSFFIPKISYLNLIKLKPHEAKIFMYENNMNGKTYINTKYRKFNYKKQFTETSSEINSKKLIDIFTWLGLRIENEHSVTIVSDITSSINGMEIRTPFLNKSMLDFANSLSIDYKVKSYISKKNNKYILKKALEKYLPKEMIYQKKMGFGYNIRHDEMIFKYKNDFDYYFANVLPKIELYDLDKILEMYEKHLKKEGNYFQELLEILIVCIWYEEFTLNNYLNT